LPLRFTRRRYADAIALHARSARCCFDTIDIIFICIFAFTPSATLSAFR